MAYKMKNNNLGKATRQAGKPKSRQTDSPINFSWSGMMDKAGTALSVAGMIPVVGNLADGANTALSAGRAGYAKYKGDEAGYKKHRNEAAKTADKSIDLSKTKEVVGKTAKETVKKVAKDTVKEAPKNIAKEGASNEAKKIANKEKKPSKPKKIATKKAKKPNIKKIA